MNIGRNDPCHCGSGKKYKKCCLAKDEEEARKQAMPASVLKAQSKPAAQERKERPKPPPDPRIEAWNARYKKFESADYEERIAIFNRTLDERS